MIVPLAAMVQKQRDQIQKKSAKGTAVNIKYVKQSRNSFVVNLSIASCNDGTSVAHHMFRS
jgi:hypothetical protein